MKIADGEPANFSAVADPRNALSTPKCGRVAGNGMAGKKFPARPKVHKTLFLPPVIMHAM